MGTFLDLSKAFDTINRDILLRKLEYYGITGRSIQWFRSYLSDRKQYVYVNGHSSSMREISTGVAQGSILGPLLFLIYINDVVRSSELLRFYLYADDTSLTMSSSNVSTLVRSFNAELRHVSDWFKSNHLALNATKSNFIIFHRQQRLVPIENFAICIDGAFVERKSSMCFLGAIVDESLKFGEHTNNLTRKLTRYVPVLYKVRKWLDIACLRMIYFNLIYSNLTYCITAW